MMRGSRNLLLAGFLSFGVTLLVAWPARSLQSLLPAGVACSALTGTVWRGHCAQLTVQGLRFGSVDWQLHPSRLLLGSLSATLRLDQPGLMLAAKIAIGLTGKVEARDLDLRLTLGALPLAAVPADLRGRVVAHFDAVDWRDGGVIALAGRVEASELTRGDREPLRIGSYEIVFDAAPSGSDARTGRIKDLGGPLEVTGSLQFTRPPGYLLQGLVRSRPEASPTLQRQLEVLGPADAEGRRTFAQEATF